MWSWRNAWRCCWLSRHWSITARIVERLCMRWSTFESTPYHLDRWYMMHFPPGKQSLQRCQKRLSCTPKNSNLLIGFLQNLIYPLSSPWEMYLSLRTNMSGRDYNLVNKNWVKLVRMFSSLFLVIEITNFAHTFRPQLYRCRHSILKHWLNYSLWVSRRSGARKRC